MKVTVIVFLFSDSRYYVNRLPLMRRQWISLKNQTDKDFDVIAVDNLSYDDVFGMSKKYFPSAQILTCPLPKYLAGSRFLGIMAAKTSHVILLDSDLIVYPTFVANYKKFFSKFPESVGEGITYDYPDKLFLGDEFIKDGKIDYVALVNGAKLFSSAAHSLPKSLWDTNNSEDVYQQYDAKNNFRCQNLGISKDLYLELGKHDVDMIGYGCEDGMFGARVVFYKKDCRLIKNVSCIHQCHRKPDDQSHREDVIDAKNNNAVCLRKIKEMIKGRETEFTNRMPFIQ
jgi:hypothetical protein